MVQLNSGKTKICMRRHLESKKMMDSSEERDTDIYPKNRY